MNYYGTETTQHKLSYDKIIKNTLAKSNAVTIRFINGLFGDDIPLDAPVEWLDKENVDDRYTGIVADFYPRIAGRMYAIEIEQDGSSGDMAVRVFKYTVGGAMLHSTTSTKSELNIAFPQPCVIFLSSTSSTPHELIWNIDFFDGQKVTLKIPAIRLAELSVEEIAKRNLFPIGQFYLRTFGLLTKGKEDSFFKATQLLLEELKQAINNGSVPYHVAVQMEDTIHKTFDNVIIESKKEVGFEMTTNIAETLPWTDYGEIFAKAEEHGRAEGKAERDMEIALTLYAKHRFDTDYQPLIRMLKDIGISDDIIEAARIQYEAECAQKI